MAMTHPLDIPWDARGRRLAGDGRRKSWALSTSRRTASPTAAGRSTPSTRSIAPNGLSAKGPHLLDIGGESSRPGAAPVPLVEELRRVLPVVERLADSVAVPISVDTTKAEVARAALAAGAFIVNDITALGGDPEMAAVVADAGAGVVLMHMQGTPQTMQDDPHYEDVVAEVYEFLARRLEWAEARGIPRTQIAIDPGIGFGKRDVHNLALLRNLERFASLGCAVLIGTSRKGVLAKLIGRETGDRTVASAVSALAAIAAGASIVRVHDVAAVCDALCVWEAQRGGLRSLV